tara:strand:+ start:48 stop:452 length:405 start_codon:yes stop_codon:yes gene_type:complete
MNDKLNNIQETRDAGQEEYAHDEQNVFANFERIAKNLHIERDKVLMTYLLKHVDGIIAYVNGHKSQREDVSGRILDSIVYLFLLWGMTEENVYDSYDEVGDVISDIAHVEFTNDNSSPIGEWHQKIGNKPNVDG